MEGLKSFLAVAKEKSISRAAQTLHMTQPALSNRIRKMEEALGFALLERNWEGTRLTRQGYYFLTYAIQLIHELEDASTVLTQNLGSQAINPFEEVTNHSNRLLIGVDEWLSPLLSRKIVRTLAGNFPGLPFRFITRPTPTIIDLVQYHGIHVGLHFHRETRPGLKNFFLFSDHVMLIYNPEHGPELTEEDIAENSERFRQLKQLPFLVFDNPILLSHRNVTAPMFDRLGITRFQVVDDMHTAAAYIEEGLAYTILPGICFTSRFQAHGLPFRYVPLNHVVDPVHVQMIYQQSEPFTEAIECLKESLSGLETELD
jgi:DNA-binding transcriptional LysR family regulator